MFNKHLSTDTPFQKSLILKTYCYRTNLYLEYQKPVDTFQLLDLDLNFNKHFIKKKFTGTEFIIHVSDYNIIKTGIKNIYIEPLDIE